jgi:lysozyme family protein
MAQYKFETLEKDYNKKWGSMVVTKTKAARAQAEKIIYYKARYKKVEKATGVPWFVVGCMHQRESSGNFNTWLHNGDPMQRGGVPVRTVQVPKGRPPNPDCTWEEGAYDALVSVEHLNSVKVWNAARVAYALELFNGFGYRHPSRDIPSPYLWGGTNIQELGKFVKDGVYDANTMDTQIGGMAVLKLIMDLDSDARFEVENAPPIEVPVDPPVPTLPKPDVIIPDKPSPKAEDTEKNIPPLTHSKSIWGGILTAFTAVAGAIGQANPWVVLILVVAAGAGLFFVLKGRKDAQDIIKHLSDDDSGE